MREIQIALDNISVDDENHYSMLAALNGMSLKSSGSVGKKPDVAKFSPEQEDLAEKALKAAVERKQREMGAKRGQ